VNRVPFRVSARAFLSYFIAASVNQGAAFTNDLVKKVCEVAGKSEPPTGHLFVRQEFSRLFDLSVSFRNPGQPLGTHLCTAMKFARGDTKTQWMGLTIRGTDLTSPLDRIEIPDRIRQKISEMLTPGSSLIIADTSINSASLPKGGDFLVLAKDTTAKLAKDTTAQPTQAAVKLRVRPLYSPW
jgi:hypothetical protein